MEQYQGSVFLLKTSGTLVFLTVSRPTRFDPKYNNNKIGIYFDTDIC